MFDAATEAGVRRVVHFSVAKPDQAPGWTYFVGKVETERLLRESGQSYAIVRPTVFFGGGRNVLINNIAWIMRKFPIFGVFGFGKYPIQPVHIRDVARVSIELGSSDENITRDIAGPERFTYREFISLIGKSMRVRRLIIPIPPTIGWLTGKIMGIYLRDRVITRAEIRGLMNGLVASEEEPLGAITFSEWIEENGSYLGREYQNDLKERSYN